MIVLEFAGTCATFACTVSDWFKKLENTFIFQIMIFPFKKCYLFERLAPAIE